MVDQIIICRLLVDLHMQQPPRGGIWVGITCDISKCNRELSNYHYSDSIIFNNTINLYMDPHTQLPPCGGIRKSVSTQLLSSFAFFEYI
ncbi:hypothetical protein V1477_019040 [Vespula maculifrons]|uniref:Uncharacterized protein n=1 Tax=Vespula maculifrons TaxID=7453 RepID=A0ABD2AT96_VESMC